MRCTGGTPTAQVTTPRRHGRACGPRKLRLPTEAWARQGNTRCTGQLRGERNLKCDVVAAGAH
eukprot:952800-Alexandrium_andersonii.AAC.1